MPKPLPIGISDFKKIIDGNYAYVDKTLLIKELLETGAEICLIPRLRRFGKTLNLSMLHYFFEKTDHDTSHLFSSLAIWKEEKFRLLQGQFPVIFFSLKDIKESTWEDSLDSFREIIASEFQRHRYLLDSDVLAPEEKTRFKTILEEEGPHRLYRDTLRLLSKWLYLYHKKRPILLIDEYDAPVHGAYIGGFYDSMITFLRNWLSRGLKDNKYLEKCVLSGILRIAKESIFSGLNNVSTYSILDTQFQDKFGLLEHEVIQLLENNEMTEMLPKMREWYNGYRIGTCSKIYNPWSVLKCIEAKGKLASYWVNTSDNALTKKLITKGPESLKEDFEVLLSNGVIEKRIDEGIVFSNLEKSSTAIWSLLLFSGYLTLASTPNGKLCQLRVPNLEVRELYKSMVEEWFEMSIELKNYRELLQSLISGDIDTFAEIFQKFLLSALSVFDISPEEPEKIYHAFVLGMLLGLRDTYEVKSNRESGYGRYDVMLIPKNNQDLGIIMEFKKMGRNEKSDLDTAVTSAIEQIETKNYQQELLDRGVKHILAVGLAFRGKQVLIRSKPLSNSS